MKRLKALEGLLASASMERHRRGCNVCRNGKGFLADIAAFRKARKRNPAKWRGMTWATLLRWAKAAEAGLNFDGVKRHFLAVDPQFFHEIANG